MELNNRVDAKDDQSFHHKTELGFNDMSTLVGDFVSFPREREKKFCLC